MLVSRGLVAWSSVALAVVVLSGCGTPVNRAPVEDRGTAAGGSASSQAGVVVAPAKPLPGAENAGKPGYYTVKPGDTLIRIGLESGQSWKDIARWNGLDNPNLIEVGQVLRVVPLENDDVNECWIADRDRFSYESLNGDQRLT
ncbi:LysM peptidoglycan-binding domain-containing protein, partial [Achromobacter xylosoxidans]|uniref:LysM peptidoglycan-binding domain-containing protein n=1 Tax=Alcaligenes xylosoxydans xylosoxydans TaxID=85698 RepID=UPI001F05E9B0